MNPCVYVARPPNPWGPLLWLLPPLSDPPRALCVLAHHPSPTRWPPDEAGRTPPTRGDEITKAQTRRANKLQPLGCLVTTATGIRRTMGD